MRWFGLACFFILLVMAWRRGELKHYAVSLMIGCGVGFILDYVGVNLGLWDFPRQPFLSWSYFLIVVPCWGIFGATINMVNDWHMKKGWGAIFILSIIVMAIYEVPNLLTESWLYSVTSMVILLGWFPLILTFRLSYLLFINKAVRQRVLRLLEIENVTPNGRVKNTR